MISLDLHAATSKPGNFVASGITSSGTRWKLVGETKSRPDGGNLYSFTVTYAARLWPRSYEGALTDNGRVFSGTWSTKSNNESGSFLFKRLPCDVMRFWPISLDHQTKAQALWMFAIRAVLDRVRRDLWSRAWIEERQVVRQRYLRIIRSEDAASSETSEPEIEAIRRCYLLMTPVEARYYHTLHDYQQQLAPKH